MSRYVSKLKVEYFSGDCMKIVGEIVEQMIFEDMLQCAEVMSVARKVLRRLQYPRSNKVREKPPYAFMQGYNSHNSYTRSKIVTEANLGARTALLRDVFKQMLTYDGATKDTILALTQSYLDEHIIEQDIP